jgi:type I restriction enzyme S subunit
MINSLNLKPGDWTLIPLKDIAEIRFSSVDKKSYPGEKSVFLCNYVDVYKNDHLTGKEQFMSATATDAEIKYFSVHEGDVLITKDSETPDDIAIPTVITGSRNNLLCGYHLALIRPNKAYVNSVFLAKQIENSRLARYFGRMCNGLTRYGLSTASIANAPIWLPPLSEQNQIARILQENDDAIRQTEATLSKLKLLKQGLMQDLLSGRVRVA